jgi:hypothetical protein
VLLVALVGILAFSMGSASAHPYLNWWLARWNPVDDGNPGPRVPVVVEYGVRPPFPAGFQERAADGARRWNNLNQSLAYANVPHVHTSNDCVTGLQSKIELAPIDGTGGTLAAAGVCYVNWGDVSQNRAYRFVMRVDSSDNFNFGTGSTPTSRYDLLGVFAHEFGHAAGGWISPSGVDRHWPSDCEPSNGCSTLCDYVSAPGDIHTMCRFVPSGSNALRTLEAHDSHTFNDAY